ncbi:hypothetical protein M9Y10_031834 [Tritrichomonas musculus]|uniref:Uncharacterized protein n=1 Tax=Tritrichomonas musculus TaxID=1915356 RepID=A0ABR2GZW6_9EUKA
MSACQGNVNSTYKYAHMCNDGESFEKNKEETMKFFKMAANKGDNEAMYAFAGLLRREPLEEDQIQSQKYCKMRLQSFNI